MKSGNLNFLEPSGPIQACNGIAFYCSGLVRFWLSCGIFIVWLCRQLYSVSFRLVNDKLDMEGRILCPSDALSGR